MKLNLTAKGRPQELILAYLQENASEVLAEKINNGTPFTKDGKTLINKKTLDGFMRFANGEARKLSEKGAQSACVEDSAVYGWAIHYFEEDSIEGTLYNEDGTEYKPPKPVVKNATTKTPVKAEPPKPKQQQGSLFDMLAAPTPDVAGQADDHEPVDNAEEDDEEPTEEEFAEAMEEQEQITPTPLPPAKPQAKQAEWYRQYLSVKEKYKDSILLYRLGDFYEMFGDDARTCADVLNLTLTGRDCGLQERVPMSGIPFHAADVYVAKLVNSGYKVAVAERLDGTIRENIFEPQDETVQDDDLPAEEMRKFDGDIEEPKIPVVQNDEPDDEDELPDFDPKAFDPEALCILDELFGKIMILR